MRRTWDFNWYGDRRSKCAGVQRYVLRDRFLVTALFRYRFSKQILFNFDVDFETGQHEFDLCLLGLVIELSIC